VVRVRGVDVFVVWVCCAFPTGEDEESGVVGVGGGGVGTSNGVAHAFVVIFRVCDFCTVPCVGRCFR
jgi:hypothetical protein